MNASLYPNALPNAPLSISNQTDAHRCMFRRVSIAWEGVAS